MNFFASAIIDSFLTNNMTMKNGNGMGALFELVHCRTYYSCEVLHIYIYVCIINAQSTKHRDGLTDKHTAVIRNSSSESDNFFSQSFSWNVPSYTTLQNGQKQNYRDNHRCYSSWLDWCRCNITEHTFQHLIMVYLCV